MNDNKSNLQCKSVIIHFHFFKNAGSTIDWILKRNFSEKARTFDKKDPDDMIFGNELLNYLQLYPETKSVSSHHLRFPLPLSEQYRFLSVFFIRNPIDRVFSVYEHLKRSHETHYLAEKASHLNIKEFLTWYLQSFENSTLQNAVIANGHVSFLQSYRCVKSNTVDYQRAVEIIRNCQVLGLVDRMDESLVLGEQTLKLYFKDIDLSYIKQNVSAQRSGTLEERLEDAQSEIGISLMNKLISINEHDLKLYSIANEILDSRLKNVKSLDDKLMEFKSRCQSLVKGNQQNENMS